MISWTERYSCYSASVARGAIGLSVAWKSADRDDPISKPGGYEVRVAGRRLTARFTDVASAQAAAVALARRIIGEASAELEQQEPVGSP